MANKAILSIISLLATVTLAAQNRTIKGSVVDSETGAPVDGVAVISGDKGVVTNIDGDFSIEIGVDDKELKLSCLGYTDATIILGKSVSIGRISLTPEEYKLSDVIVSGQFAV